LTRAERLKLVERINDDQYFFVHEDWQLNSRPEQRAPEGDWRIWLFLGGRGAGKTRSGAEWIAEGVANGAYKRIGLVGATYNDARAVMIEGVSGLKNLSGGALFEPSNRRIKWPNGAIATVLSADEPDSIRGHQFDTIWADELGCPAVDKGANQPNVFVDPKSSESALPYFSTGDRDDLIQRRFLEAHLTFWSDTANNPASIQYSGRMVDTANLYVWCWDARPYPYFPALTHVWGDGANWRLGHWLNGRLGAVPLPAIVSDVCAASNFTALDTADLDGIVTGYAVTDTMSARDALDPLSVAFHFDAVESEGAIVFAARGRPTALALSDDDLAIPDDDATLGAAFVRAQETDLPNVSRISYIDPDADYRQASAAARRLVTLSDRVASSSFPIVMDQGQAIGIGERLLQDAWVMRETASFALPPSRLALDVTDEVIYTTAGRDHRLRLTQIDDSQSRAIQAVATDPSIYEPLTGPSRGPLPIRVLNQPGRALLVFLDLPMLTGNEVPWAPTAAAFASPWPGSIQAMRSASDANFTLDTTLSRAATLGRTTADFYSGPLYRWDEVNELRIRLNAGMLASQDDLAVLGGANAIAIQNEDGAWEIVQFATATLTAPNEWILSRLLRGQAGTETAMRGPVASGARVVLLDGTPAQLALKQNEATLPFFYAWGPPAKPLSDASWQTAEQQFAGIGQRPLSPVQLAARRQSGDLVLSWIRRTRIGGDNWDQTEVPLAEDSEAYDVEILDGSGAVIRTVSSLSSPTYTYTAAQIATDFPSGLPSPFRFTVYQLSAAFGRGVGTTSST
jgi:putative tail protein/Gene Transfer Agent (GTA)-like protein/terminase large subunit-like protein